MFPQQCPVSLRHLPVPLKQVPSEWQQFLSIIKFHLTEQENGAASALIRLHLSVTAVHGNNSSLPACMLWGQKARMIGMV